LLVPRECSITSYYSLPLGYFHFTCQLSYSTGTKVIKWDSKIQTYISGHKVIIIVIFVYDSLACSLNVTITQCALMKLQPVIEPAI
jgi:hypothetical protein